MNLELVFLTLIYSSTAIFIVTICTMLFFVECDKYRECYAIVYAFIGASFIGFCTAFIIAFTEHSYITSLKGLIMNLELVSIILLYASIVLLALTSCVMFLFVNSPINERRDRILHTLLSASGFGICLWFIIAVTLDFLVYIEQCGW